jgi:hypothetical protein
LVKTSQDVLQEQISLGNNAYTVDVDSTIVGRNQGADAIPQAKRKVTMRFIKASLDVAVAEMSGILRSEIKRTTQTQTGALASSVRLLYAKEGKPYVEITGQGDLKEFGTGDTLALIPAVFYQAFVNSSVANRPGNKGGGFMLRAASAIRRKLRLKKSTRLGSAPGLSVTVGRSRAAAELLKVPSNRTGKKTGRPRGPIPTGSGIPVIYMRIRGAQR